MKIQEIITEAKMDRDIQKVMQQKGYKLLGSGQDQDAYLAPDGTIMKIFGTDGDSREKQYSEGQESVVNFIKFCQSQPNNPFLPSFGGFERFVFKGKYYLQISCERMFDFAGAAALAEMLETITDTVHYDNVKKGMDTLGNQKDVPRGAGNWYKKRISSDNDAKAQLILYLGGEEPTMQLLNTIKQLSILAKRKGYVFDLHSGNFMLGSDGHIVINDPFFTGTFRGF